MSATRGPSVLSVSAPGAIAGAPRFAAFITATSARTSMRGTAAPDVRHAALHPDAA